MAEARTERDERGSGGRCGFQAVHSAVQRSRAIVRRRGRRFGRGRSLRGIRAASLQHVGEQGAESAGRQHEELPVGPQLREHVAARSARIRDRTTPSDGEQQHIDGELVDRHGQSVERSVHAALRQLVRLPDVPRGPAARSLHPDEHGDHAPGECESVRQERDAERENGQRVVRQLDGEQRERDAVRSAGQSAQQSGHGRLPVRPLAHLTCK